MPQLPTVKSINTNTSDTTPKKNRTDRLANKTPPTTAEEKIQRILKKNVSTNDIPALATSTELHGAKKVSNMFLYVL